VSIGGGGGGWINPFAPPVDLLAKYVVFNTGVAGTRDGELEVNFAAGLCRDDVAFVEVDDLEGTKSYPVSPTTRMFLVGAYGSPARARLLDELGDAVLGRDGRAVDLGIA
jgi:hypothetical protein